MTRTTIIFLGALMAVAPATAQEPARADASLAPEGTGTLVGRVIAGDSGEPLAGVRVEVWVAADSIRVTETASTVAGSFRVGSLPDGAYYLRLGRLGYGTVTTESFELAYAETRDLGTLTLPVEALDLEPITVSTERTVVTLEADRTAYNVGVMPGTQGASVTEALRGVPELEIDIGGAITLRGSTPVIYINGRPAPMEGEALALFLEQFPADYVAKVEVIENPSARYGAEGSGGIVNLVLKEGVELGVSGSVHASAGTRGQHGVGARGTIQRGDWTVNGDGSLRLTDVERSEFDLRQNLFTDPAFLRQESFSDRSGIWGNLGLTTRYSPTERSRVFARARVSSSGSDTEGLTTTTHMDDDERPVLRFDRASTSDSRGLSVDFSAGFDYRWEPRRHELEIAVDHERGRDLQGSHEEIASDELLEDGLLIPAELTLDDQTERERETSLQVDYTRPWGEEGRMELGFDVELEENEEDRTIRFVDDPVAAPDGTSTDRGYAHRERVDAAYLTLARDIGDLSVQVGLRAEHTASSLAIPTGEEFENEFLNLFPSANASYRFDRSRRIRLSYSRRVQRPSASVLNPVDRSTDPLTRRIGNPAIEPQFTHSVSLNASQSGAAGNFRLSAHYRRTTNEWAEMMSVDEDGVSTRTYDNIASQQSYGASFTYSMRPVEGWNGFVSISGRRQVRDASNVSPRYSGSSFLWSSRARVDARVSDALSAQANLSYSPPLDLPQGRSDARYAADLGLRYRFLADRASLRLSLQDPFALRRSGVRTQDVNYIQIGRSEESTRSAVISLSYSFGGEGTRRSGRRGPR